jgi:hypothetical protein
MAYSEKGSRPSENNDGVGSAQGASRMPSKGQWLGRNSKHKKQLTGQDLADIVRLLECKLAWYGFRSVKVGPFIRLQGRKVLIDLVDRGDVLCRMELDNKSNALGRSRSHALKLLNQFLRTGVIEKDVGDDRGRKTNDETSLCHARRPARDPGAPRSRGD